MPRRGRGPSSCAGSWSARRATTANRASGHGVVRAMALSDHRRCVSTRRRARTSWTVTSTRQRRDGPGDDPARRRSGQATIWAGSRAGVGAERRPRREASPGGTTGGPPCRHHGGRRGDLDRAIARAASGPSPAPCATPRPWRRGRRARWADARPSSAGGRSRPGRAGRRGLTERRVGCRAGDGGDAAAARGVEDGQGFEAAAGDAREIAARPASGAPEGPSAARPRGVTRAADPRLAARRPEGRAPSGRAAPGPARPKGWGRRALRLHRAAARSSRRGGRPTSARGRDGCPLARMRRPRRRSMASQAAMTRGPLGATAQARRLGRLRAACPRTPRPRGRARGGGWRRGARAKGR